MGRATTTRPTLSLALGGGGARGLAHIPMLEALDELGLRPVAIAGTSMGAVFGAAYAAGLTGRESREATTETLRDRRGVIGKLREARTGRLADLLTGLGNPWAIDAELFCDLFLPERLPRSFEDCAIPLTVVATDYYARREVAFSSGPLRKAVAASIAIPGLIRPVEIDGRLLIDGAAVNPLPVDHLAGKAAIMVAVDVTGGPAKPPGGTPSEVAVPGTWDVMFGALQILQSSIVEEKVARHAPDILVRPQVDLFKALDFFQASVIFRLAQPSKDDLKRKLAQLMERA
jgi:NTE family protein